MKKLLLSIFMFGLLFSAYAKNISTDILDAASALVPSDAKFKKYEYEKKDGKYSVEFVTPEKTIHEVDVSASDCKVLKYEIDVKTDGASKNVVKTENEIKSIITEKYPDVQGNIFVKLEVDGNFKEYEVKFSTDKYRAEIEVNPETGIIFDEEYEYF